MGGGTVVAMPTTAIRPTPFAVTPRRPGEPEADLTGFRLIHRALRSGSRLLADATTGIAAGAPCSRDRSRATVQFALAVRHEITQHHEREDDVLWPVIAASAGDAVDLEPLSDDHAELHKVLERAAEALPQFARDPAAGAPLLAPVFTELADLLDEHIAEEETQVFPVILDTSRPATSPAANGCSRRARPRGSCCSCCRGSPTSAPTRNERRCCTRPAPRCGCCSGSASAATPAVATSSAPLIALIAMSAIR